MKTLLPLLLTLAFAGSVIAQAPPAPQAPPPPQQLTKEQIDALIKQKQAEVEKSAQAAQTNAPVRTLPTRRPPTAPGALPQAPAPAAVSVTPAGQPAVPAAQQAPPQPAVPLPPQVQPAPPAGAVAPPPGVPAGQPAPAAAGAGAAPGAAHGMKPAGFLQFQNAPPEQWMDFYAELVGRTILRANALPATQISIRSQTDLSTQEAIEAFEHVLALNNLTAVKIGEKFVEIVPSASALQSGGAFNLKDGADLPEAAQFVTHVLQLKHALPSEVTTAVAPFARTANGIVAIDSSQTLVIRDYAINVKRMLDVIEKIDVEIPLDVELELIPIRYALVTDVAAVLGSLTSTGSITPTGTSSSTSRTGGSTAGRRTGGTGGTLGVSTGGFGGNTGQPNQGGQGGFNPQQVQRPGTPTTGGAASAVSSFQSRLQQIVGRAASGDQVPLLGDAKIIPDERSNSLLVFATKQEREMIKKIIGELDIVQPQVLIEAVIVEVQLTDGQDTGVSIGQTPKQFGKDFIGFGGSKTIPFGSSLTNANPINSMGNGLNYFSLIGSNWEVAMTAIANDSRFEVLSRPRIQATHAVEADLFVGETRPFPTGSVSFGGQATTQIQNQRIGIGLNVLPLINVDGLVVLDIAQTVQQVGEEIQVDQFLRVPSIIDRTATSRVAVKDGDTIILGGFITSEKRASKSGVPGLKDIPYLGRLFSSKSESLVKRELIVFLRPTVLATPEVAAITAANEREKLIDVKKTEIDLRAAEQERYRKLEAEMEKARKKKK